VRPCIYVLDDHLDLAQSLARRLEREGYAAHPFRTPEEVWKAYTKVGPTCLISDVMMLRSSGFQVAADLRQADPALAVIFMTAWPSTAGAVDAVKLHGGLDYIEKPLDEARLLSSVAEAVAWSRQARAAEIRLRALTAREREVLALVAQGKSSKAVAAELGLSPKTIEDHRAAITTKTHAAGLPDLMQLAALLKVG
jgi:two-component system, LuxR family, response regulator FixJ